MFYDYEIRAINESLALYEEEAGDPGVNFIRFISTTQRHKCSVVGQYQRPDKDCVLSIDSWADAEDDGEAYDIAVDIPDIPEGEFYHGIAPTFTAENIKAMIQRGTFRNIRTLISFLSRYRSHYNWVFPCPAEPSGYPWMEEYFIYTVIRMASHFGFVFRIADSDTLEILKAITRSAADIFVPSVTFSIIAKENGRMEFSLIGGPSDAIVEMLSHLYISSDMVISSKKKEGMIPFALFYDNTVNEFIKVRMLGRAGYYSGVISRLMRIDVPSSSEDGNNSIRVMKLKVGRTTFATLDAFDNGSDISHPLLRHRLHGHGSSIADAVRSVRRAEYKRMDLVMSYDNNPIGRQSHARTLVGLINGYLQRSINSNTIAVSANLVSRDGCLIAAVRDGSSIDSNTGYCSANGQTEFRDNFVTFYRNSVYEDLPSLVVPAENEEDFVRLDYTSEIERETIAELNSSHFSANWIYYGISVLGIRNRIGNDAAGSMRLHFNILLKNILSDDFIDICEFRNDATERFENSRLIGLKPVKASVIAETAIGWILDHGDLLTNLLLIVYLVYTRFAEGHVPDLTDYAMTVLFTALEMFYFGSLYARYMKRRRDTRARVLFVRGMALKRRDKSATDVDSRRAILVSELHGSLWSMSRRMRNAGKYGAYPNAILQLMYLLDILGDTIDR